MKKISIIVFSAAVALAGCSDSASLIMPDRPQFELHEGERVDSSEVNAWVYGSFSINFGSNSPGALGNGVDANFPGHPKNRGTCGKEDGTDTGVWYNSQGKRTSGSVTQPHPHCVGESSEAIEVVLEPISVENGNIEADDEFLRFTAREGMGSGFNYDGVRIQGSGGRNTNAQGTIVAYAIDANTLESGNPKRVGLLTIDLEQFKENGTNLFADTCSLGDESVGPRCLNKVITAAYEPWGDDAVGHPIPDDAEDKVTGFLYWAPATAPFNYPQE